MKISVSLERFKKGLGAVEKIVASKSTLPVLNNVLIRAEDSQVVLSATDLEMGVNYYLGGKVEKPGSITVPGKVLGSFINNLSEDKITLEVKNNVLYATTEKSEASLNGIPAEEFPPIPEVKGKEVMFINSQTLKAAINQVGFAASFDESRPILTGVLFTLSGGALRMVATDSYRLAEKTVAVDTKEEASFIVPIKTIQELYRIITEPTDVKMVVSENQVMFVLPDMELISRVIEGEYPDYRQVVPKSFKTKAVLPTHELASTIKTASFFARENANNVKLTFRKGAVGIEAASSQLGSYKSQVGGDITGEDNEISFNARYLLDALGGVEGEEASIELVGKLSPGVIKTEGKKSDVMYIIMPLRS
ncbi:DNA polymerase III subunit beta [candidate division Kazan bacterium RBG_13_50_9]|uniref:Beta sliding clamp n=1 Tax=candidate division Kazan bacterium RBG_13_50_9 TaxID=1798535 RepID=A0A1F4NSC1_UNCK3|nr:MAG: DNA polymerase III subunit beta [candidate division Kazan bacterium RBG_13_50_9]